MSDTIKVIVKNGTSLNLKTECKTLRIFKLDLVLWNYNINLTNFRSMFIPPFKSNGMNMLSHMTLWVVVLLLFNIYDLQAQDPLRFTAEIELMEKEDPVVLQDNLILFTGSSSIRLWKSLKEDFKPAKVINRGFGGSTMSDLLYHLDRLVLKYRPHAVFIYEGDNDLAEGKNVGTIVSEARQIVKAIKSQLPGTMVHFIAVKPSLSRWHLRDRFEQLNYQIGLWSMIDPDVRFIDIWSAMCDKQGVVNKELFVEDGLHMNAKGYAIWKDVIGPYLDGDMEE